MLKTEIDDIETYAREIQDEAERRNYPFSTPAIHIRATTMLKLVAYVRKLERVREKAIQHLSDGDYCDNELCQDTPLRERSCEYCSHVLQLEEALKACDGDDSE